MVRVIANGPEDLGSIPGRVKPKTQKMILDASLLNTQQYKVGIKGKVEQFWLMLNWILRNITVWSFNRVYLKYMFTNHI